MITTILSVALTDDVGNVISVITSTGVVLLLFHPMLVGCEEPINPWITPRLFAKYNSTKTSKSSFTLFFVNHNLKLCTPPGIIVKPNSVDA
jgi:hypothetical protein